MSGRDVFALLPTGGGKSTVLSLIPRFYDPTAGRVLIDGTAVTSYKLVVSGTVEERVLGLQDSKRDLLAGVFEASDAAAARLSLADLKSMIG